MRVPVSEARDRLRDLVALAEAGEEIILTENGRVVAKLVRAQEQPYRETRRALMERVRASGSAQATKGPSAARSQDFLYGDDHGDLS